MKRRDLIESLALLPITRDVFPKESNLLTSTPAEKKIITSLSHSALTHTLSLRPRVLVMDGHAYVMSRQLLLRHNIKQHCSDSLVNPMQRSSAYLRLRLLILDTTK